MERTYGTVYATITPSKLQLDRNGFMFLHQGAYVLINSIETVIDELQL